MKSKWKFAIFLMLLAAAELRADASSVIPGAARLEETSFARLLAGKRIGVLAHHASRLPDGSHLVDRLYQMGSSSAGAHRARFQLTMIFAPEHGYRSVDDNLMPDSTDPVTGLPVYSLYGPRKAPTDEMLSRLDVVVIDLQDVGLRYYTYPATMVYVMRACQRAGKPVIVLDRPNPLGGETVEGAVLEKSLATGGLTTLAMVPTRHGMTLGELAILYNHLLGIRADLTVVPISGWSRAQRWQETGLKWYPPSPALVEADQADLYAAFGTLEAANLAVGRGIENSEAFRRYGAPWIRADEVAGLVAQLNALALPGLAFEAAEWVPDRAVYQRKICRGFKVRITDATSMDVFRSLIVVSSALKKHFGERLDLAGTRSMLGSSWLLEGIVRSVAPEVLTARARRESEDFLRLRAQALLY